MLKVNTNQRKNYNKISGRFGVTIGMKWTVENKFATKKKWWNCKRKWKWQKFQMALLSFSFFLVSDGVCSMNEWMSWLVANLESHTLASGTQWVIVTFKPKTLLQWQRPSLWFPEKYRFDVNCFNLHNCINKIEVDSVRYLLYSCSPVSSVAFPHMPRYRSH